MAASSRARLPLMGLLLVLASMTGEALATDGAKGTPVLSTEQWRADLRFLATELPKRHVNAFAHITRETFDREVAKLDSQLGTLDPDAIFVGMDRIENLIGDGHTYIRIPAYAPAFPLRFERFGDDYRLVGVVPGSSAEAMLGARLVRLGDTPVSDARTRLLTLAPASETQALREIRAARLLNNGMVLHGLGLLKSRDVARYTLRADNGETREISLPAGPAPTTWRSAVQSLPLSEQHPDDNLRCDEVAEGHTVYCNFHSYKDLQASSARLFDLVGRTHPDRLVIDFRNNDGGDFCEGLKYLVKPIRARGDINRDGHLFVLIGPRSFSAALSNAVHFRQLTRAILVGEPIGELPNSYQEAKDMVLPNSGWVARYSTHYYQFTNGRENLIRPDKEIVRTWSDYRAGKDAVLDWVLSVPADANLKPRDWPGLGTEPAGSEICHGDF
jgi:Peptidase family S41